MQEDQKTSPGAPETSGVNKTPWRLIKSAHIASYVYGDEPEIVHFVRMNRSEPMYHVCREDAFGIWPWTDGMGNEIKIADCVMSKAQVKERFGIDLDI